MTPPALFIAGERDTGVVFAPLDAMAAAVPNLRARIILPGAGHWIEERPNEVNAHLIEFLRREVATQRR